jgi:alpha-D-xyloside xylohydrolase
MQFAFPDDPAVAYLDRQYLLGDDLLVAPVLSADGVVQFYLPRGRWTNYFTGEVVDGGSWRTESHGFDSLPLYVREGAVIPIGSRDDRPDYDYLDGLTLEVYPGPEEETRSVVVTQPDGDAATFVVSRSTGGVSVSGPAGSWGVRLRGGARVESQDGRAEVSA